MGVSVRPADDPEAIAAAVAILEAGGLVGMPTETVYGLAADAGNGAAVARIYAAKGRPRFNPLIAHVADRALADRLVIFDELSVRLADAFWPGPLTLVMPRRPGAAISDLATAGLDTLAIRMPAHPAAITLLRAFGRPLAAPSANRSGHVSATTAAHVAEDLGDAVGLILDAGRTAIGVESTILMAERGRIVMLREGGATREQIEDVLGQSVMTAKQNPDAPTAPGQLLSHYAPKAKLRLDVGEVRPGEALLAFGPEAPDRAGQAVARISLSESGDLVEAAARLFSALRELDNAAATIAVTPIPSTGLGAAIRDRLERAAAPR